MDINVCAQILTQTLTHTCIRTLTYIHANTNTHMHAHRLVVREDGQGEVVIAELTEILVDTKTALEVCEKEK